MPGAYPDFSWFTRTVRILPVVAFALLVGGTIGGVSVFAVDSALTAPPRKELRVAAKPNDANAGTAAPVAAAAPAKTGASQGAPEQIRVIEGTTATPSPVAAATPAPVQAQTAPAAPTPPAPVQAQTVPLAPVQAAPPAQAVAPTAWPDALSRANPQMPAAQKPAVSASTTVSTAPQPPAVAQFATAPVKAAPRRHAANARKNRAVTRDSAENATMPMRPVYDYYGRHYGDRRPMPPPPNEPRYSRDAAPLPPQPAPPSFGGLFSRDQDDDSD